MAALRDKCRDAARIVDLILGQHAVQHLAPLGDLFVRRQHRCQLFFGDVHCFFPHEFADGAVAEPERDDGSGVTR
jgi:hypothetical protein